MYILPARRERKMIWSLNLLNLVQALIVFVGVASGLVLCGAGVAAGRLSVGDAVLFLTLIGQLYGEP